MDAYFSNPIPDDQIDQLNSRTQEIGIDLFSGLNRRRPWFFQRQWWDDRIMKWSMRDEQLKTQLFRFVDVLPMLNTNALVVQHLRQYLQKASHAVPWFLRSGLAVAATNGLTRAIVAYLAKSGASSFARKFIAGATVREVIRSARRARRLGRGFTLDILGEAVTSQREADHYFQEYQNLLTEVSPDVNAWKSDEVIDFDSDGPIPRVNLSVKLSALDPHFDPIDFDQVCHRVGERLSTLLRVAKDHQAFVNVDMESYEKKDLTLAIFKQVLSRAEFRDRSDVGIVIQCYLRDSGADLEALRDWARQRGVPVWVRLVKGAYWDYETAHARAEGWPIPVYQIKSHSDANFEKQVRFVMQNRNWLRPALASHNLRSLSHGLAVAEHLGLARNSFEIQMLFGMAESEKRALVERGYRLRVYMPYGQLIPGMAYLVRRLLENTANDSFLRIGSADDVDLREMMATPVGGDEGQPNSSESVDPSDLSKNKNAQPSASTNMKAQFQNHPPIDFSLEENRERMSAALGEVSRKLGVEIPVLIGTEKIHTGQTLDSLNPAQKEQVVGVVSLGSVTEADLAVNSARNAFKEWSRTDVKIRTDYLRAAAESMRKQFFELAAWIVLESGKPWREATNDVCESIDFLEFYSQQAIRLDEVRGADVPGEENRFSHIPRGVVGVISPWNFPLAILTGMTAAALSTGNTVVMKPAEQSSVIAWKLMEIFQEVQIPAGVVNFLPGLGETAGARIVEHPDVALIAFTGSRQVGLWINQKAAEVSANGLLLVKKVIAEMGGKNSILVDTDADLDEAVLGAVHSAFGFQGQKCSACSRVIVLESVYETFVNRLEESVKSLIVGDPSQPGTIVGPVIDQQAQERVNRYISLGRKEATELVSLEIGELSEQGYYVSPTVFSDVSPDAKIAQEEIFGPVLAIIKVRDLGEAIEVANRTDYGLTGGVFSRSPESIERVRRELMVGNLYINRGITGALVGRQPFGGFKMSGIGSKAGGEDYLLQFVLPRTVTENTMRRGFVPPE